MPLQVSLKKITALAAALIVSLVPGAVPAESGSRKAAIRYVNPIAMGYNLPDPLRDSTGRPIHAVEDWENRRADILDLYRSEVYGRVPEGEFKTSFELAEQDRDALGGAAIRKQVAIAVSFQGEAELNLLLYLPKSDYPAPVFLILNFKGNHTVHPDPAIFVTKSWTPNERGLVADNRATEEMRGYRSDRFPVEHIVRSGFGLATVYYGDIDPDYDDGFHNGVHGIFRGERQGDSWGSISAWAFGLSRIMDYLEADPDADPGRVIVTGHSRLGKAALWAGARDRRFAMVISNESGCGGAALFRRKTGETIGSINRVFPHWFCDNFKKYRGKPAELPVDQHMLIALAAPRPVHVASAERDWWSDPYGEFLAAKNAGPVYRLYGYEGLDVRGVPVIDRLYQGRVSYHVRRGGHNLTSEDWRWFLESASMETGPTGQ